MGFPAANSEVPSHKNRIAWDAVRNANKVLLTNPDVEHFEGLEGGVYRTWDGISERHLTPRFRERVGEIGVPLAQQIIAFSAHRVAGNQGLIVTTDSERSEGWLLDLMRETNFNAQLMCGLEYGAAYGGFYMRPLVSDMGVPHMTVVRPDFAEPTWAHNRLKDVCLRFPLRKESEKDKYRYVLYELHHLVPRFDVPLTVEGSTPMMSVIDYRLYKTKNEMAAGVPVSLLDHPDTVYLADLPQNGQGVARRVLPGFDRISVEYVPNLLCRPGSINTCEGRSDLEGVLDLLDKYNLIWSTIIDEMDKGRARILVSPSSLVPLYDGHNIFDSSNTVFTPINMGPDSADKGVQQIQFTLQTQMRLRGADAAKVEIIELAGWSPASFGEYKEGTGAESGLAKEYREQQTRDTVEAKRGHLIDPVRRILENLARLGGLGGVPVTVKFPQQNVLSDMERTEVAIKRYQNGLSTLADVVQYLYPDLNAREVEEKTAQIKAEELERREIDQKFQDMRDLSTEPSAPKNEERD